MDTRRAVLLNALMKERYGHNGNPPSASVRPFCCTCYYVIHDQQYLGPPGHTSYIMKTNLNMYEAANFTRVTHRPVLLCTQFNFTWSEMHEYDCMIIWYVWGSVQYKAVSPSICAYNNYMHCVVFTACSRVLCCSGEGHH